MNHSKIGTFEAITLILSVIIVHTVLSLPKTLLNSTNSATFINLIYVSILAIIFVIIVFTPLIILGITYIYLKKKKRKKK